MQPPVEENTVVKAIHFKYPNEAKRMAVYRAAHRDTLLQTSSLVFLAVHRLHSSLYSC